MPSPIMSISKKTISGIVSRLRCNSLKARGARGAMVLTVATFIERLTRLVRNMILARLLAPEDFGLMAIIMAASVFVEASGDIGIRQSVIHNIQGRDPEYLNMAWWLQTVRALCLYAIAFLVAPLISWFYGRSELVLILRIAFVTMIFNGVMSPRAHVLEKELRFGRWVFIAQGSAALSTVLTVTLAFWIRNLWALVIGFTVEAILRCLLSFIFCPFRPRLRIDRRSLSELLRYARGMLGLTLLTIVAVKTDVVVLGKLVSAEQVGIYALAFTLAQQPTVMFGYTIGRVLLSVFAQEQDSKQVLRRYVLRITRLTFMFGIPLLILVVIYAKQILSLVWGPKYAAGAIPFAILCFSMLFSIQGLTLSKIYLAVGQPHLHRRFVTLLAILIIGMMYPGVVLFGLSGAAGVLLLSNAIAVCAQVIWVRKVIGLRFRDYIRCLIPLSPSSPKWKSYAENTYLGAK